MIFPSELILFNHISTKSIIFSINTCVSLLIIKFFLIIFNYLTQKVQVMQMNLQDNENQVEQNGNRFSQIRARFQSDEMISNIKKMAGFGISILLFLLLVYNLFVPHDQRKQIPEGAVEAILKLLNSQSHVGIATAQFGGGFDAGEWFPTNSTTNINN